MVNSFQGTSYTFFTPQNGNKARDLIKVLDEAKQNVPEELRRLAESGGFGGGRGRGRGGPPSGGYGGKRPGGDYGSGGGSKRGRFDDYGGGSSYGGGGRW